MICRDGKIYTSFHNLRPIFGLCEILQKIFSTLTKSQNNFVPIREVAVYIKLNKYQ